MQSLRAEDLADYHLINCNVALNLLDQTAQVRVRGTNSLPQGFIPPETLLQLKANG